MTQSTHNECKIHPTALVDAKAQLDTGVTVGPYALIGPEVKIGKNTTIHHHASVEGFTEIGEGNEIYPYAFLGARTQDLKFTGGRPGLKIGKHNVFREYSTLHLATNDGEFTIVGDHNLIMAYCHVAHDCIIGSHVIMSSNSAVGGHGIVEDHVTIGWGAGVHQHCKIGAYAMIGACSKLVQDVPPFMIADGVPADVVTINKVGLERNNFKIEEIDIIRKAYKILYRSRLNRSQALKKLNALGTSAMIQQIIKFIEHSERGLA